MQALNYETLSEDVVTKAFEVLATRRLDIFEVVSQQDPIMAHFQTATDLTQKLREALPSAAKSLADHLSKAHGELIDQVFFASFVFGFLEAYLALQAESQGTTKH